MPPRLRVRADRQKNYAVGLEMFVPAAHAAGPLKSPSAVGLAGFMPWKYEPVHKSRSFLRNRAGLRFGAADKPSVRPSRASCRSEIRAAVSARPHDAKQVDAGTFSGLGRASQETRFRQGRDQLSPETLGAQLGREFGRNVPGEDDVPEADGAVGLSRKHAVLLDHAYQCSLHMRDADAIRVEACGSLGDPGLSHRSPARQLMTDAPVRTMGCSRRVLPHSRSLPGRGYPDRPTAPAEAMRGQPCLGSGSLTGTCGEVLTTRGAPSAKTRPLSMDSNIKKNFSASMAGLISRQHGQIQIPRRKAVARVHQAVAAKLRFRISNRRARHERR